MAESLWRVKYDEELVKKMEYLFINKIVPENFILVVHRYNTNVLTLVDIEQLRKAMNSKATEEVNQDLLLKLKNYKGWFEVILQVCNDPGVKQAYLVEAFEEIKSKLDEKWTKEQTESQMMEFVYAQKNNSYIEKIHQCITLKDASYTFKEPMKAEGTLDANIHLDLHNYLVEESKCHGNQPTRLWEVSSSSTRKEIDTGLANVTLRSESNQGTVAMGRQLSTNGVWETDSACMASENTQWKDKNTKELSTEDRSRPTQQQSSWEGLKVKNGKPYCDICFTSLTSEKAADDHCKGKQHQKKLKEAFPAGQESPKAEITMAASSQATYDAKARPPCFEPNPVSNEAAVSSGPVSGYNGTPASLKEMFCIGEVNTKKLLTGQSQEGQSVTANTCRWGGLTIKNGNQYCDLCDSILTSQAVADAHCKGKSHEKKLKLAFPASQSAIETGITTVSEFQASSSRIKAIPTSSGLSSGCEVAVCSAPLFVCQGTTASLKLTSSNDKKIPSSLGSNEASPTGSGATQASPTGSGATHASPTGSGATQATPTTSSTMRATVASPVSSHAIAAGSNQVCGSDEGYIINNNGTLECKLCKVPVSSWENATQHLNGSSHKKKLEALKAQDDCNEVPPGLGPHGEIMVVNEDGAGKCLVCNVPVNSRESAKQHVEGRGHINKCKKYNLPVNVQF